MTGKSIPQNLLNQRRRRAVELRLDGWKIADISREVSLSAPTIIAAHKLFLQGGWPAVEVKPRGRPSAGKLGLTTEFNDFLLAAASSYPDNNSCAANTLWTFQRLQQDLTERAGAAVSPRTIGSYIDQWGLNSDNLHTTCKKAGDQIDWLARSYPAISADARKRQAKLFWAGCKACTTPVGARQLLYAHSTRGQYCWLASKDNTGVSHLQEFFTRLANHAGGAIVVVMQGVDVSGNTSLKLWLEQQTHISVHGSPYNTALAGSAPETVSTSLSHQSSTATTRNIPATPSSSSATHGLRSNRTHTKMSSLTHLQRLEAESIHIMREVVAEANNPVMMFSIGKDSAVMLHLAMKAFYPAKPPFPLLHVDTGWKFKAMYAHRDKVVADLGLELITYINQEGVDKGVNPFSHGSALHTDIMKTEGLRQALQKYGFDAAFGGARRDEEKSRAKERIFSFRNAQHRWDPKNQRPELWNLYNARKQPGESIRVFPLSNWTELDVWQYIHRENIPVVPLYLSASRPVVERDGTLIMVDDDRMPMNPGEVPMMRNVRFRTLGCYPLTGAIDSEATTVPDIIQEMLLANTSERQGRLIDHDSTASMEKKKQEGYF